MVIVDPECDQGCSGNELNYNAVVISDLPG